MSIRIESTLALFIPFSFLVLFQFNNETGSDFSSTYAHKYVDAFSNLDFQQGGTDLRIKIILHNEPYVTILGKVFLNAKWGKDDYVLCLFIFITHNPTYMHMRKL